MREDVSVELYKPWQVRTIAERHGSFLEVKNTMNSIWRVKFREKCYLIPVTMEIVSRGIFVIYLSNVPDGDGYQPVAKCTAVEAARECLEELAAKYPQFEFGTHTIAETIEECVLKRLKRKLGAFADAKVKCGAITLESP